MAIALPWIGRRPCALPRPSSPAQPAGISVVSMQRRLRDADLECRHAQAADVCRGVLAAANDESTVLVHASDGALRQQEFRPSRAGSLQAKQVWVGMVPPYDGKVPSVSRYLVGKLVEELAEDGVCDRESEAAVGGYARTSSFSTHTKG
jgi:hypothetical protein